MANNRQISMLTTGMHVFPVLSRNEKAKCVDKTALLHKDNEGDAFYGVVAGVVLALAGMAVADDAAARMDACGGASVSVVQQAPGYNSWPMIQMLKDRLVCAYSRGSAHTITEGSRGVYARVSLDGGKTWGTETCVVNDPHLGEVTIGKGVDASGAMLLWVRNWGSARRHDLYRTEDGVRYEKIASPALSPMPIQITDVFAVPDVGLMSLWFAGSYKTGGQNAWGVLTSADNGRTWVQRTVEDGLSISEWPTEQSAVWLGGGRILAIARSEGGGRFQFQLTSADSGRTWRRMRTNITDVRESTPSLLYDPQSGVVSNYYYQRGARLLKRRRADAAYVFDRPESWPEPEVLANGHEFRSHDAGNVNATAGAAGAHHLATYSGTDRDTAVFVIAVPAK